MMINFLSTIGQLVQWLILFEVISSYNVSRQCTLMYLLHQIVGERKPKQWVADSKRFLPLLLNLPQFRFQN